MGILKSIIFKQYDNWEWFGGIKNVYGRAMGYQGAASVFVTTSTLFLVAKDKMEGLYWLEYWMVLMVMFVVLNISMLFAYKVDIPTGIRFGNKQGWKHYNPYRDFLKEMDKKQDVQFKVVMKRLDKLEKK